MRKIVNIGGSSVGDDYPPYIVAELSGNHNGDIDRAKRLIEEAKKTGVNAVKLQTYTPDTITIDYDGPGFIVESGLWEGRSLYDLYQEAHTPWEWHVELFEHAKQIGLDIFSTPFDETAVDFLEKFDPVAYKIASLELKDKPLLKKVAQQGRPVILSTGLASLDEVKEAVNILRSNGTDDIVVLHCISGYPTPTSESNIARIGALRSALNTPIGLSDHALSPAVSIAAVALGACFIEKHFTLSRDDGGPDAKFSLNPEEFRTLCTQARDAYDAIGIANYERTASEQEISKYRRSIYVVREIRAGEPFSEDNVRRIRPGYGMSPAYYEDVIGKTALCDLKRGTPLDVSDVDGLSL
ncbi:pseudaminic acid synthase [Thalassospira lucentensis]|uniref:pseudaminic acid synthase n=1 Tax=Thalassospira lucentensis TaxID=168935 RepID=UPI003D2CE774